MHEPYFSFRAPKVIYYGRSSFKKVGSEAASRGKKALIVCDKIMEQLGYTATCRNYLKKEGVASTVYAGVHSEPTDEFVKDGLEAFRQEDCDIIISLGGGSCIDTAKAISIVAFNGGYIGDFMAGNRNAGYGVPHIAIPTTAGSGSEASDVTVIISRNNDEKMMIKQPAFMPQVAIVDPALTLSSPDTVTAATGLDALTHAIESFLSRKAHPLTDTLALSAMNLIVSNIRKAYQNGNDLEARDAMALGSLQAGMAFSNASVALVHGMSRPIGAFFHVPHGISNAMLLPLVLEYAKDACIARLAQLGRIFLGHKELITDEEAADFAIAEVKQLCLDLKIPNLKTYGIDKDKFEQVVEKMALDAVKSGSPANNPKVPDRHDIEALYRKCYAYIF